MKKLLLILLCLPIVVCASFPITTFVEKCDNIILKNGKEISAKVIEITLDYIKYKECTNQDGTTISIYKNEVLMLRYYDGSKEIFNKSDKKYITYDEAAMTNQLSGRITGLFIVILFVAIILSALFLNRE